MQTAIIKNFQKRQFWLKVLLTVAVPFILAGCPNTQRRLPTPRVQPITYNEAALAPNQSYSPAIPNANRSTHPEWQPNPTRETRDRWQGIMIHHTATNRGSAEYIDQLHKQRGWDGMGYDFLIGNGNGAPDGLVEVGWRWVIQREGAHCRVEGDMSNYFNEHTIGIALVGNFENYEPTPAQYASLLELVQFLKTRYRIPIEQIKGHRDVEPTACPGANFDMAQFKRRLQGQY